MSDNGHRKPAIHNGQCYDDDDDDDNEKSCNYILAII